MSSEVAAPEADASAGGLAVAGVQDTARADAQHFALLGLFLGRIRKHDAALGHLFAGQRAHHNAVAQGSQTDCHV